MRRGLGVVERVADSGQGRVRAAFGLLAALLLALLTFAAAQPARANAPHQVSVTFSPRVITLGESATLTVVIRVPQGGGNRSGLSFTLSLPSGLVVSGVNVLPDCAEHGSGIGVTPSSGSVQVSGLSMRPGGTCTVDVTVSASAAGEYAYPANSVNVNSNQGSNGNAAGASLTVNPAPTPTAQLSATSVDFGAQAVGTTSAARSVTLSNGGGSALSVSAISASGDFRSSGCSAPSSIAAGASCTLSIVFAPTATGPRSGSIQIETSVGSRTLALSGTGTAPAVSVAPASVDFGAITVNTSATAVVTLSNGGSAALAIASISSSGAAFSQTSNCPSSLAAGSSCAITARYAPTATGAHSGQLSIASNAFGSPAVVSLSGSATPPPVPAASLAPTSVDFGAITVNTSATSVVVLTNSGSAALALVSVSASGAFFSQTSNCPASLAAGASCAITARYAPTATGAHSGQLSIASNASASPALVSLSGSATSAPVPAASLAPASVDFGAITVDTSATSVVTLSNSGSAALAIASISSSGAAFSQTSNCPSSLAAGASCAITARYAPTATGAHSGHLSIASNAPGSPAIVPLSGSATPAPVPVAALSPAALAFGSITVGTTATASATLSNTGTAALAITSIAASGSFFSRTHACPSSLAPGASCTIAVTYAPTATGSHSGELTVQSNASGGPVSAALSGSATPVPAPVAALSRDRVDFGSQPVNTTSAAQLLSLSNTGNADLVVSFVGVSGDFNASGCAAGTRIAAGSSCTLSITFRPEATGTRAGSVSITTNADASPHSAALTGTGTAPGVTLSPATLDFRGVAAGGSATASVTLTNTGSAALAVTSISAAGGGFSQTNNCPSSLAPGASCVIRVTFAPAVAGSHAGQLGVLTNAQGAPYVVAVSGMATPPPAPAVTLSRASIDFGSQAVGSTSSAQSVTLTNSGDAPLTIRDVAVAGDFAASGCAAGSSLAPGASCTLSVTFSPSAAGVRSGSVAVTTDASGSPHRIVLGGSGSAPGVSLAPTPLEFAPLVLGNRAAAGVALTNSGTAALAIASIAVSGSFFSQSHNCPASLAPGASCVITVTYAPTSAGEHTGQLSVTTSAQAAAYAVALRGSATPSPTPAVSFTPASVDYGSIATGTSALLRVVMANRGHAPLEVASIAVSGAFFTQTNTCPATLGVGAACDIWITFAPAQTGAHSGQLSVASNAPSSPSFVPLSGSAMPASPPRLELSREVVDFGAQTLATTSAAQLVTVRNAGSSSLELLSIAASGDFGFSGCATPLTLSAGASCTLSVTFLPTALGPRPGAISIHSDASSTPSTIALGGEGTPAPVPGIAVAPGSIGFGSIVIGERLIAHLALTNTGTAPLVLEAIVASGAHFSQANDCPASLAPKAACTISVTYGPAAPGVHAGEVVVRSNAAPSPLRVPLSGTALAAPAPDAQLSRTSLTFAQQYVGTTSAPQTVTLTNTGTAPLRIRSIASSGDFGYSGCGFPATLAAGESCAFAITFRPSTAGPLTGAIEVVTDAPSSPHRISLNGTGATLAVPEIYLRPSSFAFGSLRVGASATQRLRLANGGAAPLALAGISVSGAYFSLSHDCPATLAMAAGCDLQVTYAPTAPGAHGGHLRIESNAAPSPYVVSLSGAATPLPPPFLSVAGSVDFGPQIVGTPSRRALDLANTGEDTLVVSGVRILGSPAFTVDNPCAAIAPGRTCSLTLAFTPPETGGYAARLDIVSNHAEGVVQVQLGGTGVPRPLPALELSVDGLGFGNQVVGTASESRSVRLTSRGGVPLRLGAIEAPADFIVDAARCPVVLQPGASCEVGVVFRPLVPGPRIGRLTVESNAAGSPHGVSLTGTGCRFFTFGAARNPDRICAP